MPEKEITNYLIIDWKGGSTRTRKSKPKASDLGTHELSTTLTLDVVIPEVDVDELRARVEVPKPRVEQTALDDVDVEGAPDWMDVADEIVADFADRVDDYSEWYDRRDSMTLRVIEDSPTNPDVEKVRRYLDKQVKATFRENGDGRL